MDCLKCQKEIVKTEISTIDGSARMELGGARKIKSDGKNEYIPCPYCGTKNILCNIPPGIKGVMRFKLIRYED
jgi:DNA-directed RNA polymerase subunit RPC12/RpoP